MATQEKIPLADISLDYFDMLFTRAISIMAIPKPPVPKGVKFKRCFFDDLVDMGLLVKSYREVMIGSKLKDVEKFRTEMFKVISGEHSTLPSRTRSGMVKIFGVAFNCYINDQRLSKKEGEKSDGKEIPEDTDSK